MRPQPGSQGARGDKVGAWIVQSGWIAPKLPHRIPLGAVGRRYHPVREGLVSLFHRRRYTMTECLLEERALAGPDAERDPDVAPAVSGISRMGHLRVGENYTAVLRRHRHGNRFRYGPHLFDGGTFRQLDVRVCTHMPSAIPCYLGDAPIRHIYALIEHIDELRKTEADAVDPARLSADVDHLSDFEYIRKDQRKAAYQILHQPLRSKANGKADD